MNEDEKIAKRRKQASWPTAERKRKPANLTFDPDKLKTWREHATAAGLPLARWLELAADAYVTAPRQDTPAASPDRCPPPARSSPRSP